MVPLPALAEPEKLSTRAFSRNTSTIFSIIRELIVAAGTRAFDVSLGVQKREYLLSDGAAGVEGFRHCPAGRSPGLLDKLSTSANGSPGA